MVTPAAGSLFSTACQAILYGYAVAMFMLAMWIMFRDKKRPHVNYYMVVPGCTLFVLATAEMGVDIARLYKGFISTGPNLEGGPEAFFADVNRSTFIVKSCLYNAQTLILDAVVIYRTYVVWSSFLVCVLPMMGWFALLATSIGVNVALVSDASQKGNVFANRTGDWITSVYALTLVTNLLATGLLALKIWMVARRSAQYSSGGLLMPVLRVVIESGAIYSLTITIALILFATKSNGVYVLLDMISPIISIVFNMLIIRIGLAKDPSFGSSGTSHGGGTGGVNASGWAASHGMPPRRRPDGSFELHDFKVEITQVVEDDASVAGALSLARGGVKAAPLDLAVGAEDEEDSKRSFGPQGPSRAGRAV